MRQNTFPSPAFKGGLFENQQSEPFQIGGSKELWTRLFGQTLFSRVIIITHSRVDHCLSQCLHSKDRPFCSLPVMIPLKMLAGAGRRGEKSCTDTGCSIGMSVLSPYLKPELSSLEETFLHLARFCLTGFSPRTRSLQLLIR